MTIKIYPSGIVVFVLFCVLLAAALTDPTWLAIASAVATVFIALMIAGFCFPSLLKKTRGL